MEHVQVIKTALSYVDLLKNGVITGFPYLVKLLHEAFKT